MLAQQVQFSICVYQVRKLTPAVEQPRESLFFKVDWLAELLALLELEGKSHWTVTNICNFSETESSNKNASTMERTYVHYLHVSEMRVQVGRR